MIEFQSTPGIAAGRIPSFERMRRAAACFNPRPALLPGESARVKRPVNNPACFNPRPALLPGESARTDADKAKAKVSIHARHCCRANRLR